MELEGERFQGEKCEQDSSIAGVSLTEQGQ